jgi:glycosyltransferase involved in cell wall biosynthesis
MTKVDVSAVVIFHREGYFSNPAMKSVIKMTDYAKARGISVEIVVVLDSSDSLTSKIVRHHESQIDKILCTNNGDLGVNRNHALCECSGEYVTFLDGDDLWGEHWIFSCFAHCKTTTSRLSVLHPEFLYFFTDSDFDAYSWGRVPSVYARSLWFRHVGTEEEYFQRKSLLLDNVYSANSFGHRSIYEKYPYKPVDRNRGFGIEDWSWNLDTIYNGLVHEAVAGTVHLIRVKESGSLGRSNTANCLLPSMPEGFQFSKFLTRAD